MTRHEAAVISAYTGVLIGRSCYLLQYASKLLGRTVEDYELSCPKVLAEIQCKVIKEFKKLRIGE